MIRLDYKFIGHDRPCFIIAEAGVNHNGDVSLARRLIDAASDAGADAVKFQTFKTKNLVTIGAEKAEYQKRSDSTSGTQYDLLKKLEFTETDFRKLSIYAKKKGMIFLSTAFDEDSVELLSRLNVPAYKIPSGEITNFPLLKKIALYKKPVILSTGMSTIDEIKEAVLILIEYGCSEIILLHCTTSYPAPTESVNLRVLKTLRSLFCLPTGYSDHTSGITIPIAAVAMGACVVEKHLTLDRSLSGPDHKASIEPDEFKRMVSAIREIESALGDGEKKMQLCEASIRDVVRKSIVSAKKISSGSIITEDMLAIKRPGTGIEPKYLKNILGKSAVCGIKKDTVITWDMIQ
jgi:N,N'-diacetyllegionaminate synthase